MTLWRATMAAALAAAFAVALGWGATCVSACDPEDDATEVFEAAEQPAIVDPTANLWTASLGTRDDPTSAPRLRWRVDRSTSRTEVIDFEWRRADLLLEGVIVKPVGEGPWPAIALIHGATNQPQDKALQVGPPLAMRGYVTVAARYSFAGPRSPAEARLARPSPEGDRALCLAAGEFARHLPCVGDRPLGVAGISAGGFLIVRLLCEPHPFAAAAVVSAGIRHVPAEPSPIDEIAVPVATFVGTEDDVVAPENGRNFDRFLRQAGKPRRLVVYDGAPHDLFAWDGERLASDIADWFDRYLKP